MTNKWIPLIGLLLLGIIGGVWVEASENLIRIWGKDMGFLPKELDPLNMIEILSSFKFLWSPLFVLSIGWRRWSSRRLWMILMMIVSVISVTCLAFLPFFGIWFLMVLACLIIGRVSFDMVVIAAQIDAVDRSYWGLSENFCVNGYRLGIMLSGSGALFLSHYEFSWSQIYLGIALVGFIFLIIVGFSKGFDFLDTVKKTPSAGFWFPLRQWLIQPQSWVILLLMVTFRTQDGLVDSQRDYFLLSTGFTKPDLALFKSMALWLSVSGGILSGLSIRYYGYAATLTGAVCLHGTAALFIFLSTLWPQTIPWVGIFFMIEQLTRGFAMISLFSFQLVCCQVEYAVTQLALLTAFCDLGFRLASLRSGWIAQEMGWSFLFGIAAFINMPLLGIVRKSLKVQFVQVALSGRRPKKGAG
jgi:hypothetical protein